MSPAVKAAQVGYVAPSGGAGPGAAGAGGNGFFTPVVGGVGKVGIGAPLRGGLGRAGGRAMHRA